ncbi:serine O-acetyltransferase [Empedobacter falsenii]
MINKDLYRYVGNVSKFSFLKFLLSNPGFKFIFYWRLTKKYGRKSIIGFFTYQMYKRYSFKFGYQIPLSVEIGEGLLLPHFGFIVVNSGSKIGKNCNILQGVTLGNTKGGKNPGNPTIGDEVYIGPSASIVGNVKIGNRVLIAPNAYVNFDVPDDSIVIGNPAKIISKEHPTKNYINRIYNDKL